VAFADVKHSLGGFAQRIAPLNDRLDFAGFNKPDEFMVL